MRGLLRRNPSLAIGLALTLLVLLQSQMDEAALKDWGWRIPFVVGAACAVLVFWLRTGLHETEAVENAVIPPGTLLQRLLAHPRELLIVLALTAIGPSAAFDSGWGGALAGALRDAAAMVSARLGHPAGVKAGHV